MEFLPDFLITPYQLIADPRVSPLEERVYSIVYWFRSMRLQKCTAGNDTIAKLAKSKSTTAIQNALTNLEKLGYVRRTYKDASKRVRDEIVPLVTFAQVSPQGDRVSPHGDTEVSLFGDQNKNTNNQKTKRTPREVYGDPAFQKFWQLYPRREGKGAAWKAWEKLDPDEALAAKIVSAVESYSANHENWKKDPVSGKPRDGGRFIPHPSTFLNERRFDDAIGEIVGKIPSRYDGVKVTKATQ